MTIGKYVKKKSLATTFLILIYFINIFLHQSSSAKAANIRYKKSIKTNEVIGKFFLIITNKIKQITIVDINAKFEACDKTNSNNSFIYCYGKLLKAVSLLNIYQDSKTFVDKPMKLDPLKIKTKFEETFPENIIDINEGKLIAFLNENFDEEGTELER